MLCTPNLLYAKYSRNNWHNANLLMTTGSDIGLWLSIDHPKLATLMCNTNRKIKVIYNKVTGW